MAVFRIGSPWGIKVWNCRFLSEDFAYTSRNIGAFEICVCGGGGEQGNWSYNDWQKARSLSGGGGLIRGHVPRGILSRTHSSIVYCLSISHGQVLTPASRPCWTANSIPRIFFFYKTFRSPGHLGSVGPWRLPCSQPYRTINQPLTLLTLIFYLPGA